MVEDIYCGELPEPGLSGSWRNVSTVGSCNACYSGDNRSSYHEKVFEFRARSLIVRLCAGHLRELVKQSRYR